MDNELLSQQAIAPIKLNRPLTDDEFVIFFEVTGDLETVVYATTQRDTSETFSLFSVPAAGGASTILADSFIPDDNTLLADIAPDGSAIVYKVDQDGDGLFELVSAPVDGGPPVQLSASLPEGATRIIVSPDSSTVVYDNVSDELFSVPIGGGAVTQLNPPEGSFSFSRFTISPDSSTVVTIGRNGLASIPIEGGSPVQLNPPLPEEISSTLFRFAITPDSSTVVYRAEQNIDNTFELFNVPIDGGTPTLLNTSLTDGRGVSNFRLSPDGSTVVYSLDQEGGNDGLFSVPIEGGIPTQLSLPFPEDIGFFQYAIAPDGDTVVYRAAQNTAGVAELFSVPIEGGTPTRLNGPLVEEGNVGTFAIAPDSSTVVYAADQTTDRIVDLFSVPIEGGDPVQLDSRLLTDGPFTSDARFAITPNSDAVVYFSGESPLGLDLPDVPEIFSVPLSGGTPTRLNAPLQVGQRVVDFEFAADSTVVYAADQDTEGFRELFSRTLQLNVEGVDGFVGNLTAEADLFTGTAASDVIRGLGGDDVIRGASGSDRLMGSSGSDALFGNRDDDTIDGGSDDDRIAGGPGDDQIAGGLGDDQVIGNAGNDELVGDQGRDELFGGTGNDRLTGGLGGDRLAGGSGSDTFIYRSIQDAADAIIDFEVGVDRIDVSQLSRAEGVGGLGDSLQLVGHSGRTRVIFDGDGLAGAQPGVQLAVLIGVAASELGADSFVV